MLVLKITIRMRPKKLKRKVKKAIKKLIIRDEYLLANDLYERCITFRLGFYLQKAFRNYDVDCEYNGFINSPKENNRKYINILYSRLEELNRLNKTDETSELLRRTVYPDIIVHKRGEENNLLIIESKKSTNSKAEDRDFDMEKLSKFTSSEYDNNLNYRYGLFIDFIVGKEITFELVWFQDGKIVDKIKRKG